MIPRMNAGTEPEIASLPMDTWPFQPTNRHHPHEVRRMISQLLAQARKEGRNAGSRGGQGGGGKPGWLGGWGPKPRAASRPAAAVGSTMRAHVVHGCFSCGRVHGWCKPGLKHVDEGPMLEIRSDSLRRPRNLSMATTQHRNEMHENERVKERERDSFEPD